MKEFNVTIKIDDKWIDDGCRVTSENLKLAIRDKMLPHAESHEVIVEVEGEDDLTFTELCNMMNGNGKVHWDAFPEFGCFFGIEDGQLMDIPMNKDGTPASNFGLVEWRYVTAIKAETLNAVNARFGTEFSMSDFAGR